MSTQNLLRAWPELEAIRDRLLAIDADAIKIGREKLTLLLYSVRTALPVPKDRLLNLQSAAAYAGMEIDEFVQLMADNGKGPVRNTARTAYFRAGDIQVVLEGLRGGDG